MTLRKATVPPDAGPQRLDRFLRHAFPGVSMETARKLVAEGRVRIRGKVPKLMRQLWGGEEVEVNFRAAEAAPRVQGARLEALFEDASFLILNKPPGLVVEPEGRAPSVVGLAATQFQGFEVRGAALPGVAHRLDRDTSGCLALAKTDVALAQLRQAFVEKRVDKRYVAIVLGAPPPSGSLEGPYGRDPANPRKFTTRRPSARRAALSFVRVEQGAGCALVEIKLDTGRTHQIRVQMSEAGYPLLGDPVYGTPENLNHPAISGLGRMALHAQTLRIAELHPGLDVGVQAPRPKDLEAVLRGLRTSGPARVP